MRISPLVVTLMVAMPIRIGFAAQPSPETTRAGLVGMAIAAFEECGRATSPIGNEIMLYLDEINASGEERSRWSSAIETSRLKWHKVSFANDCGGLDRVQRSIPSLLRGLGPGYNSFPPY